MYQSVKMLKVLKEKVKRLLNSKKKRIAAVLGLLLFLLAIGCFLFLILRRRSVTGTGYIKEQNSSPITSSSNGKSSAETNKFNRAKPLSSKLSKQSACENTLVAFDKAVKANANQAYLEDLLKRVEELCPESKFHDERMRIHNSDVNFEAGAKIALNDSLERPNLNISILETQFQKVKELCPTEPASTLIDYTVNLYEGIKEEASKNALRNIKKPKRLLRTLMKLKPEYVDDPPLQKILGSDDDVVGKSEDLSSSAKINHAPAFGQNAEDIAEEEAQEILRSDTPKLINSQQDRRANLTDKLKIALDARNDELKNVCALGQALPAELQAEFNKWKSVGFETAYSPEYVAFIEKSKNSDKEAVLYVLDASATYLDSQGHYLAEARKHRTDRDDVSNKAANQAMLTNLPIDFLSEGVPISDAFLEWLKGKDWEHMIRFVEHELTHLSSNSYTTFRAFAWSDGVGAEYYKASSVLLEILRIRDKLRFYHIAHSPDVNGYVSAVEKAWQGGSREYEKLKYEEYNQLCEFEELENTFKGEKNHRYRDEFANIYESAHVKLNSLDFLTNVYSIESEEVKGKAKELGIVDPENIKESQLNLFEGCPKVYNLLIIKLFAGKVKASTFEQIAELLQEHKENFKKITFELVSLEECKKLATKTREGSCLISSEGIISCSTPRWNERVKDSKWLGWVLFKPTKPYQSSYLRDLLSREQELRKRYDHLKYISMFINDINIKYGVHPGRPTKRMNLSTKSFYCDSSIN